MAARPEGIRHDEAREQPSSAPPRFCPRCGGEGDSPGPLCHACGEPLLDRGYCPICEDSWRLAVGAECPKHDLPLQAEAPRRDPFGGPGDHAELVTVATFTHPNLANAPRIRLEAEGIPTFLDGERIAGSTLYQVATGGVRLQVPAPLASAARVLIDQSWSESIGDDDDLEDAWDDLGPDPGHRRRAIMKLAILVFLFGPAIILAVSSLIGWLGPLP